MNRRIGVRLGRLEQRIGTRPDLAAEAARYGALLWSVPGGRCYIRDTPAGVRLAVVGAGAPLVHEAVGICSGDLR